MNKIMYYFCCSLILTSSCTSNKAAQKITIERPSKDDQASKKIHHAQALHDMGEVEAAIASLASLVDKSSYLTAYDKAYELLITWLLQKNRYDEAKRYASYFLMHHQKSKSAQIIADLFNNKEINSQEILPKPEALEASSEEEQKEDEEDDGVLLNHYHRPPFELDNQDEKSLGILLPLSGPFATFGKKALLAMSIGLDVPLSYTEKKISVHKAPNGLKIFLADTSGDQKQTRLLIDELAKKHKVSLIIGEITTDASIAASERCEQLSIPLLNLSRHPLAREGSHVFGFSSSLGQQISFLVAHAIKTGHKRFGIIYPRHNYGISAAKTFYDEVLAQGGSITALEAYDAHQTSFTDTVKKLVGLHFLSARPEYPKHEKDKNIFPIVDFDALFIPEFNKLAFIVPALVHADLIITNNASAQRSFIKATRITDIHPVQLLGTDSWNDKDTIAKLGRMANGAFFVDVVDFNNEELSAFKDKFITQKLSSPTSLEIYAHDAAKLAANILLNAKKKDTINNKLAKFTGSVGFLKPFSFSRAHELVTENLGFEINDGASTVFNSD